MFTQFKKICMDIAYGSIYWLSIVKMYFSVKCLKCIGNDVWLKCIGDIRLKRFLV